MTQKSFLVFQILPFALCASAALLLFPHTAFAFPTVQTTNTGANSVAGTTHPISFPSGIQVGDLLILLFAAGEQDPVTITDPTGWSSRLYTITGTDGGDDLTVVAYYMIATTSSPVLTITTSGSSNARSVHQTYRITGASGNVEGSGTTAVDASSPITPDPPNLAPSWGAKDTLWLAVCDVQPEDVTGMTAPGSYSSLLDNESTFNEACSAQRNLNASSEDPGTFSGTGTGTWYGATIAIEPSGTAPNTPTNLLATAQSSGVVLTWTEPASSPGIDNYAVYRNTAPPATTLYSVITSATDTETYTDTAGTGGSPFYYRVTATNSVGTSTYSNGISGLGLTGRIIRLKGGVRLKGNVRLR